MAIAIGGNQINKAYLGTTEIHKMYLGSDLVFDNSIQPSELTPIMTNFRILEGIANRVYFDTPLGPVTGLTTQGFTISGVIQITSVNTTDNYFTIATGLNFWDQAMTIRLENGNGVVYDFTMESIYNEMDEPTSTTIRYMSADASGSGDGESEVNAWTASQAESATAGMTVWMKAGDYGAVTSWGPNNDGSSDNPIKFIGYKDTIGDITENYLDSYDSGGKGISTDWDVNEFPSFKGSSTIGASTATAISFSSSYIIIRNLQTENYKTTMTGGPDHFVMDNFNSRNNYHSTETSYHGFFLQNNTTLNNMRFRNLVLLNHSQNTFAIQGTTADFNLYDNIRSWNDRTIKPERVDYHLTFNGNNNVLRNCYVENFNDDNNGSSHGIGMKTTGTAHANNYNLIELSTAVNQAECFYLRNYYCDYNVIKDCIADNNGSTSFNDCGGLWFWGGVHYNIYERCTVKNMNFCAIGLTDNDESPSHNEVGTNNTVRNCIFSNCKYVIYGKGEAGEVSAFTDNYFYNNIFHNITEQFYKIGDDSGVYKPVDISNLQMTNNVIDGCSSQGDALTGFVWDSNNFWQSWSNGLGTNSMNIDPQWVDTVDFVPQNESMIAGRVANLHYDINKTERAETDSTLGAVLLESEDSGGGVTPPDPGDLIPILMNFRVEQANADRILFDTPLGYPDGLTTTGFVVNDESISDITKVSDTEGYFTLASSLLVWDNKTIKLENGDGTIHDFTMENIDNQLPIPSSFNTRYVTVTGGGLHDGSSEDNAWDLSELEMTEGRRIAIKVGDYTGQFISIDAISGYFDGPCTLEGYKVTPGDITSNYWNYGDALDSAEMPLIDGEFGDNIRGINLTNSNYFVISNLQFKDFGVVTNSNNYGVHLSGTTNVIINRVNVENVNRAVFITGDKTRVISSNVVDGWEFNYFSKGNENAFYLNKSYCDDLGGVNYGTDYYYNIIGNQNICKDNLSKRVGDVAHFGHGVSLYDGYPGDTTTCVNNLVDNLDSVNILSAFELRHSYVYGNVIKNSRSYADGVGGDKTGGIHIRDGAHDNIIENCKVDINRAVTNSVEPCIAFQDYDESGVGLGSDNIIRNCIFNGGYTGILFENGTTSDDPTGSGNQILNCTFNKVFNWIREYDIVTGMSGTLIKNCILNSLENETNSSYNSTFIYENNNIFDSWTNSIGTGSSNLNPNFVDEVDFVPQAETMKAPTISGVPYDYNDDQRDEAETTIGAVMLVSEKQ